MINTKIEWCNATWNPLTGCLHGCEYCYAQRIARRFGNGKSDGIIHFLGEPMVYSAFGVDRIDPYPFGFAPTFHRYKLDEPQHIKKSKTIFVCSMADLFGEWVPDSWIEQVFAACEKAPQHTYLFLTKNPKRYVELDRSEKLPKSTNMWYGSTMTTQSDDFLIDSTRNTFLSIEPLLSDFPLDDVIPKGSIKWVIVGAETGNRRNKVVPQKEWIDNICKTADLLQIPVFMKKSCLPIIGEANMRREFPFTK